MIQIYDENAKKKGINPMLKFIQVNGGRFKGSIMIDFVSPEGDTIDSAGIIDRGGITVFPRMQSTLESLGYSTDFIEWDVDGSININTIRWVKE